MRLALSERLAHAIQVGDRLVFSSEVEEILYGMPEFLFRHYHLVKKRHQPQQRLIVRMERPGEAASQDSLRNELICRLHEGLGIDVEVHFISKEDERFKVGYKYLKVVEE